MDNQAEAMKELDYGFTTAVQGLIRALGMHRTNEYRKAAGVEPEYTSQAFSDLIDELGLHHNRVVTRWQDKGQNYE